MKKRTRLPRFIKSIVSVSFSMCPYCKGDTIDNRYNGTISSGCRLRRWSRLVVVQECKTCGLRFSMGWKAIRSVLAKQLEESKTKTEKTWYGNQLDRVTLWLKCNCDAEELEYILKDIGYKDPTPEDLVDYFINKK